MTEATKLANSSIDKRLYYVPYDVSLEDATTVGLEFGVHLCGWLATVRWQRLGCADSKMVLEEKGSEKPRDDI